MCLITGPGDARFIDANTVAAADGRKWTADRVIIAVGGRAGRLPIPGAELCLTYEDVRSLTSLPGRVCVIGLEVPEQHDRRLIGAVPCEHGASFGDSRHQCSPPLSCALCCEPVAL